MDFKIPKIMGIINVTPDSFYDGGASFNTIDALKQAGKMISEGADILDIGAASSRPGAEVISIQTEIDRAIPVIEAIRRAYPDIIISIDTFHSKVAAIAIDSGADMVNDISAGIYDSKMIELVAQRQVPYIIMHMKGTPQNMQTNPSYENVTTEVVQFLSEQIKQCHEAGIKDIIVDPGFGFGKTLNHNFELFSNLSQTVLLGRPILIGISRKSMVYKILKTKPVESLNGTTALNMLALEKGASILRVHDVKEAKECLQLWQQLSQF